MNGETVKLAQNLYCVARGHPGQWEAFCLDIEIAVQGRSFDEVREKLEAAIRDYVLSAASEPEPVRQQLFHDHRAPLHVRLKWAWRLFRASVRTAGDQGEFTAGFPVPCPA